MAVTGKPGISTPREASREVRNAVDAIRARLEALEKLLNTTELSAGAAFQSNQKSNASISFLQSQINVLASDLNALSNLFDGQSDGIVVLSSGELITRTIEGGSNVTVTDGDGVDGNPTIDVASTYPFLTNEEDTDLLTESGLRIRIEG